VSLGVERAHASADEEKLLANVLDRFAALALNIPENLPNLLLSQ
jgi:hypothetical protein